MCALEFVTDEQLSEGLAILEESIEAILITDWSEFGNE